jgi:SAM-dependent methyltransferase
MTGEPLVSGLFLDALRLTKSAEQNRREADYLETLLDLPHAARLLDVPCGGGRLALEFAARGHHVTGVDLAQPLLDHAQHTAAERGLIDSLAFYHRDMRDLPWTNAFDGAYCFWESFGTFDDAGNRAFLDAVRAALKPGARFVFDTHIAETLLPRLGARHWEQASDELLSLEQSNYDHTSGMITRQMIFVRAGVVERHTLTFRLYTYRELVALVTSAGFAACDDYAWLSQMPFHMNAPRLVLAATK